MHNNQISAETHFVQLGVFLGLAMLSACSATEPPPVAAPAVANIQVCNTPGRCGQAIACEGSMLSVTGMIDGANIFDRTSHPALPYQKFLVTQTGTAGPVEVWVEGASSEDSAAIFRYVRAAAASRQSVTVVGRAVGVDLPITGQCNRAIKLVVSQKSAVQGLSTQAVRANEIQGDVSK